jgi:DNA-binding response OmpR family regulator
MQSMASRAVAPERDLTVLVADEDPATRILIADNLEADGYGVLEAEDREQAIALLQTGRPDLVVLDVNGQTLALLDAVRGGEGWAGRVDPDVPILVLTSRADELHRVRVLDRAGDDVVCKPLSYVELRARVTALASRSRVRRVPSVLAVGSLRIDVVARRVSVAGVSLELPAKEYELLRTLAADPSRVFTKEELLRDMWGFRCAARTRTVDSHASRLRSRLRDADSERAWVVNIWGVGYKLASEPEPVR